MGKKLTQSNLNVPSTSAEQPAVFVFGTIADTTWRLFVPTVGMTLLGTWIDATYKTLPWCMITGIVLGTVMAVALVRRQLRESDRSAR